MIHETPPPVQTRNAGLPAAADTVLSKALAKSPSERYPSCSEFVEALDQAFSGRLPVVEAGATVRYTEVPPAATAEPDKRAGSRWLVAAAGVLVLGGGALAIWKPWVQSQPPRSVTTAPPVTSGEARPAEPEKSVQQHPKGETGALKIEPRHEAANRTPTAGSDTGKSQTKPVELPEQTTDDSRVPQPALQALRLGQEQLKSGDNEAALQSFTKAISLRPGYAQAYHNRGKAHQLLEQPEAAIQDYTEAIHFNPRSALSYSERGVCLVRLRRDDQALADFNRALELRPEMAPALNGRGGIFLRRRQYDLAIRNFTEAIRVNPQFAQAYENRARARRAMGDNAGAEADLKAGQEFQKRKN